MLWSRDYSFQVLGKYPACKHIKEIIIEIMLCFHFHTPSFWCYSQRPPGRLLLILAPVLYVVSCHTFVSCPNYLTLFQSFSPSSCLSVAAVFYLCSTDLSSRSEPVLNELIFISTQVSVYSSTEGFPRNTILFFPKVMKKSKCSIWIWRWPRPL